MSTRSTIGMVNEDGSITSIYCHWDGYPSGVGATLLKYYTNFDMMRDLLALGNLSSLEPTLETCEAYMRDRGEPYQEARTMFAHEERGHWQRHNYVLQRDLTWTHNGKPLEQAIAEDSQ